ncbi:MAG TPA: mechanosensitive ion channel family protein [Nitrospirota bacterium]|nr:mechanosensitive ion channel family protein [Nitrospirota bacterium]
MKFVLPAAAALGFTVVLLIARSIVYRILHTWANRTSTQVDDIVIESTRNASILVAVAVGIHLGLSFSGIPDRHMEYLGRILRVIIILAATFASATLAGKLFTNYIQKSRIPIPTTGLAYGILKGTIFVIGFLIILTDLGISIAPLITALGVGGLAVALALQDTLANLFAGVHILMEKSIRIGDFIKLETGQEGYVDDITWRTTRIRMLPNNIVVIPNNKLAQSVVTNYSLPEQATLLYVPVSVAYSAEPESVEAILIDEVKKAIGEVPSLLGKPEPGVLFVPGFGESSLDFTLVCTIAELPAQNRVLHELRKRILARLKKEGIEIPYPQRTVHLRDERDRT